MKSLKINLFRIIHFCARIESQILLRRQHYGWQKNPGIPGIPGIQKIQSDTISRVSGINVGTIRKYELGIRNPKPDQLEKIATALGLNVSVFLDFNIETVGDVLSLLFSIDDSVNLSLAETPEQKISLTFDNPTMQDFFRKWCQFKNVYEKEKAEILAIEDEDKRQEELDKLNATLEEWKLRAMGTTIGCHTIIKKGTEGNDIKTYDLT